MDSEDSDLMWDKAMAFARKDSGPGPVEYRLIREAASELGLWAVSIVILRENFRSEIAEQIIKTRLKDG